MTKEEFKFVLDERIQKIIVMNDRYDLEHKSYLSFSGGKDSVVVHKLLDLALPDNNIPRLFLNTGIEYRAITDFVKTLAKNDSRIIILSSGINIPEMLRTYGYPFKSKEHSNKLSIYQHSGMESKTVQDYLGFNNKSIFLCPKQLRYQFTSEFTLKVSDKCCYKLKKEPAKKWAKDNCKSITMTGMRSAEGGQRANKQCSVFYSKNTTEAYKGDLKKFHPIFYMTDEWEKFFIEEYNLKLAFLYYAPYNFKRTGCKGCPFSLKLQEQLDMMKMYLPNEYNQCLKIWGDVYKEYQRIGFRLEKYDINKLIK